jgi:hypothetical protein
MKNDLSLKYQKDINLTIIVTKFESDYNINYFCNAFQLANRKGCHIIVKTFLTNCELITITMFFIEKSNILEI